MLAGTGDINWGLDDVDVENCNPGYCGTCISKQGGVSMYVKKALLSNMDDGTCSPEHGGMHSLTR